MTWCRPHISDRVAVMYGPIVEMSPTDELSWLQHPYTAALLSAVPVADPRIRSKMQPLEGDIPSRPIPRVVAISIPDALLLLIYVGNKHRLGRSTFTSWPVIGKPSYHCLESQTNLIKLETCSFQLTSPH